MGFYAVILQMGQPCVNKEIKKIIRDMGYQLSFFQKDRVVESI